MSDLLRQRKELFVSGHAGSPPFSVLFITVALLPALILVSSASAICLSRIFPRTCGALRSPTLIRAIFECITFILPLIATLTVAPTISVITGVCGLCIAALSFSLHHTTSAAATNMNTNTALTSLPPSRLLRGSIAILTAICILAVDFNTFPRTSAKTEEFGTSLMDAGVGVVAFAGGLTSRTARRGLSTTPPPARSISALLLRITPLILLAVARSVSHAALHLPLHVSEYGVEWNFFATLAVLAIFDDFFLNPVMTALPILQQRGLAGERARVILITSMAMLMMLMIDFIYLGDSTSLAQWLLHGERGPSFFQRNREGFGSLPGFITLHLIGTASGLIGANESSRIALFCAMSCAILLSLTGYFWNTKSSLFVNTSSSAAASAGVTIADGFPISRRLANTPYIAWTSLITLASLGLWRLVIRIVIPFAAATTATTTTMLSQPLFISMIIESAGIFPGPIFLFANILTGLANTSADIIWGGALDAPPIAAFCICSLQAIAVSFLAVFLHRTHLLFTS